VNNDRGLATLRSLLQRSSIMARKYSKGASKIVENSMRNLKEGTLKRGKGGRGGAVKSRKQAIAIGLSEARKQGKKVPKRKAKK
jgi:Family of unknown function (DUF6496)